VAHDLDLGLRFIVEPSNTSLSSAEAEHLRQLKPAGIMLRRRNFRHDAPYEEWLATYAKLLADVRDAIGRDRIIVSIDHEGGQVHRVPPPITRFPYPAFYSSQTGAVRAVAQAMAEELRSLGINVSYSPCADIHSNPNNPVINQRAFGTDPAAVGEAAVCCAAELRANGIVPCAKHFPGHGDTSTDSHVDLPIVDRSEAELEQREFIPFRRLIENKIEMIMSAHIMLPQVAPGVPATISPEIITGILRKKMGFSGVTIADALGMKGIQAHVSLEDLGRKAHQAGIDLFLMVGDSVSVADALTVRASLETMLSEDPSRQVKLWEAQERVENLLKSLPQHVCTRMPEPSLLKHARLAETLGKNAQWASFEFNPLGFT